MNGQDRENLKELFGKFVGDEQAEQVVEDIRKGEQILRSHSAPEPDGELIADIKAEIAVSLSHRKERTFRRIAYEAVAVAAAFILVAVVTVKIFEAEIIQPKRPVSSLTILPKAIWDSECLADDGADSAALVAEVEQVENDVLAMRTGENNSSGYEAATELEMELTEIGNDFWKG
jgi:hypothetical protein